MNGDVMDPGALRPAAENARSRHKVLSTPDRLLLPCRLTRGEQCVSDREHSPGIGQPTHAD